MIIIQWLETKNFTFFHLCWLPSFALPPSPSLVSAPPPSSSSPHPRASVSPPLLSSSSPPPPAVSFPPPSSFSPPLCASSAVLLLSSSSLLPLSSVFPPWGNDKGNGPTDPCDVSAEQWWPGAGAERCVSKSEPGSSSGWWQCWTKPSCTVSCWENYRQILWKASRSISNPTLADAIVCHHKHPWPLHIIVILRLNKQTVHCEDKSV